MPQGHGLGPLKVGVPRHRGLRVRLREVQDCELQPQNLLLHPGDRFAQEQALIEGDLVVPASSGVDLRAEGPEGLREADLDVRVDVLQVLPPGEGAALDLAIDSTEALRERPRLFDRDDPRLAEHLDVRDAAGDVVARELAVHREGREEPPRGRVDVRGRDSCCPGLRLHDDRHRYFDLFEVRTSFCGAVFSPTAAHVRAGRPQT